MSQQPQTTKVILIKGQNGAYMVADQNQNVQSNFLNEGNLERAAHPNVCILHMFFKIISGLLYFLSGIISTSTLTSGLAIIVVAAFDFWVVKNISGRYIRFFLSISSKLLLDIW